MTYSQQEWRDYPSGGTAISAARLNHMEQGIADAHSLLGSGGGGGGGGGGGTTSSDNTSGFWNAKIDFKCSGDGLTDDSVALNLGFGNGGYIYLPPGDYLCVTELQMNATIPTYFFGPGRIVSTNDGNAITVSGAAHTVDGISVQGGGGALNNQTGIVVQSNFSIVKNVSVKGISRAGIVVQGDYGRVEGNWLNSCSVGTLADPMSVASIYVEGEHVKTTLNHLSDTQGGITYLGTSTASIVGGLIDGNTLYCNVNAPSGTVGISGVYAQHLRVVNNHLGNYVGNSIDLFGPQYSTVGQNTIYNGQHDGIFVGHGGTKAVAIVGNTIRECLTGVKVFDNSQQVNITGNEISACGWGVVAQGAVATGEQPLSNIRIESNDITCDTTVSGGRGISAKSINGLVASHNSVINSNHEGIYANDITYCDITKNQVKGAGQDTAGTWASIHTGSTVDFITIDDNLAAGSANLAILVDAGTKVRIRGNRWDNISVGITNNSTGAVVSDNLAW